VSEALVVITGATAGIGQACVTEFRSAGFHTLGVDIEPGSEADEHLELDLGSPTAGIEVADQVGTRPVAVLVNNAAEASSALLAEAAVEQWDRTFAVNLRAPFLLSKALLPGLQAEGGEAIVNVASVQPWPPRRERLPTPRPKLVWSP
jgi:NAD(P)-dependent dehydrogenase (short-subunit alcohol dehydrogenase family)